MADIKAGGYHYVTSGETGYTYCGRYVTLTLQVTRDGGVVTCATCLRGAHPDPGAERFEEKFRAAEQSAFEARCAEAKEPGGREMWT